VASFGERLKRERENRRISLEDVSLSTKIGTRLLQALEEEKFDQLPGGIFNKGFVRAYARHLGLDENQAVADYLQAVGEVPPSNPLAQVHQASRPGDPPAQIKKIEAAAESPPLPIFHDALSKDEDRGVSIPWGLLAALLFAVALTFSLWSYFTREPQPAKSRVSTSSRPAAVASTGYPASEPSRSGQPQQPQEAVAGGTPSTTPSDHSSMATAPPGSFVLLIHAKDDSWLKVTADGNQVFDDTLAAPGEKSIPARDQIVIKAGNIGGLDFTFNGKSLPKQGVDGEVKTLTFRPDGLQPAAPKPPS
jgi:cytoskeletal protein RodZ